MTDVILIEGLQVEATIGVHDWEQQITQPLVFDFEFSTDITLAAAKDELALTLDYFAISEAVTAFCQAHNFALIETLAERLAAHLIEEFGISRLEMTLKKPQAVPAATAVGLRIVRGA